MSTYCTRAQIEAVFGKTNVLLWADLDNDADAAKITARINDAIAVASEDIDDVARCWEYGTPLTTKDTAETPRGIIDLAANLAGIWLYEARGSVDFNERSGAPYHRLAFKLRRSRRILEEIRTGKRKLNAR